MLTHIKLQNFKCFNGLLLPLSRLTLLTGFNAAGKSTAIQTILLLAQTLRTGNKSVELPLNGPLSCLGTPGEVLNSGGGDIVFEVESEQSRIEWTMQAETRAHGRTLKIRNIKICTDGAVNEDNKFQQLEMLLPLNTNDTAKELVKQIRETIFISAVRMGTADVFPSPEELQLIHADVGIQGEFAPWWLERFIDEDIEQSRCHPLEQAKTLRRQLNAWAGEFFPGAMVNTAMIEKTSLLRLEFKIGDVGDWCRPANIGYGLTYAFPVIVACLLAKPGQMIIVDSPEAHLHPLGQSKMGKFLAKIASAGVQILVETHSDHILNGVRLAVKNQDITPDQVSVHFFNHVKPDTARVVSPSVDKNGSLSEWPAGFFDQSEKDLASLAGWD